MLFLAEYQVQAHFARHNLVATSSQPPDVARLGVNCGFCTGR